MHVHVLILLFRPLVLLSNAFVAFLLNVAAVFLVSAGSGLVLTLAGVFKDILLEKNGQAKADGVSTLQE